VTDRGRGLETTEGPARFIVMRCRLPTAGASPSTPSAVSQVRPGGSDAFVATTGRAPRPLGR